MSEQPQAQPAQPENLAELDKLAKQHAAEEKANGATEGEYIPNSEGEQAHQQKENAAETLAFLFKVAFDVVAARKGEHWKLAKDEAIALGAATDECLPDDADIPPWATLAVVGCTVCAPRIIMDAEIAKAQAEAKAKAEAKANGN